MILYILLCDHSRVFGDTRITDENGFIGAYTNLDQAKGMIKSVAPSGYYETHQIFYDSIAVRGVEVIYEEKYCERYSSDNFNRYKIISYEYQVKEIIENEELKKRIKKLEEEVNSLKKPASTGKYTTQETPKPTTKKEEKPHVRFW